MGTATYTQDLREEAPRRPKGDLLADITKQPHRLLDWVLARVLLGEPVEPAETWLDEHEKSMPARSRGPMRTALLSLHLGATGLLLGRGGGGHLDSAWTLLQKREDDEPLITAERRSFGLHALASLRQDEKEAERWRAAALEVECPEWGCWVLFEQLFLGSPESTGAPIEVLATASARVLATGVIKGFLFGSPAPLIITLAARARLLQTDVRTLLHGRAGELDRLAYGSARKVSREIIEGEVERSVLGKAIQLRMELKGRGSLATGVHELRPILAGLPLTLGDALGKRPARNALTAKDGEVHCLVRLGSEVNLAPTEETAFEARFRVAHVWALRSIPSLRAGARLTFERSDAGATMRP